MDVVLKLLYNVALLFIMMLPGFILKKCRLSTDGLGKGLSNLVLYVAQPALVFMAYVRPFDKSILLNALMVFIFSIVAHVIFSVVAMLSYKKAPDAMRRMLRFATIFSNAAFMGIPLVDAVLGGEATLYATIYNITFNLFLWSLGVHICTSDRDYDGDGTIDKDIEEYHKSQVSFKKALLHPVTIAAALGLLAFFFSAGNYIPDIVSESLTMLKNLVAPLSMIVIGLRLGDIDFRGFWKDKNLWIFILLRHLALPVIVFAIMRLIVLVGLSISTDVMTVVLLMASAPAATSATMFAEKYDCDAVYVSKIVAISTILCIATMPIIILLTNV